jgi:hypothetical protein
MLAPWTNDEVPGLRERLCILAGKLLQKKEVCNKAGMYSSRMHRSDIIQEYFYAQRQEQEKSQTSTSSGIGCVVFWVVLVVVHSSSSCKSKKKITRTGPRKYFATA